MRTNNFNDSDNLILAEHRRWAENLVSKSDKIQVRNSKPVFRMQRKQQPNERYDQINDLWRINESDIKTEQHRLLSLFKRSANFIMKLFSPNNNKSDSSQ